MARGSKESRSPRPAQVMTVDQVADYLQLNRLTVYRYIREGRIPAARIGKLYRVLKEDVDRFLAAQRVAADRPRPGAPATAPAGADRPAPPSPAAAAPAHQAEPRFADQVYVGPAWAERLKERQQQEQASLRRYPIEWVMRGLH